MPENFGSDETELIHHIYEAALDASRWEHALNQLREMTDSSHCNLVFYDQANPKRNNLHHSGYYPEDAIQQYLDAMIDADIAVVRVIHRDLPLGVFSQPERLRHIAAETPATVTLDEARDFFENKVQEGPTTGTLLFDTHYSAALFALKRTPGAERYSDRVLQLGNRISPHICRAMRIHHQLNSTRQDNLTLQLALQKTAAGIALIDDNARVLIANAEATRLLSEHPSLRIGANGRIQATCKNADTALRIIIEHMLDARRKPSVLQQIEPSLPLPHAERMHPLKLSVVPLRSPNVDCPSENNGAAVAVFLTDPERRWHVSEDYLHHAYELTPAECSVAQVLVNTGNIRDIAEQRGTTESTARWQLKRIMEKTATHSQAELMRVLIKLSDDFSVPVA